MSHLHDPDYNPLVYSMHRWHVDEFLAAELARLPRATRLLDVGGHRQGKRGQFDLERSGHSAVYLNRSPRHAPHVLGDASQLPFRDGSFPAALCCELLEHVPHPEHVLAELARVLAPDGLLFITVPFLVAVHADPSDYGRYTESWWRARLPACGFRLERLEPHGHFYSVMVDHLRDYAAQGLPGMRVHRRVIRRVIATAMPWLKRLAIRWDRHESVTGNPALAGYTTGHGLVARRVVTRPGSRVQDDADPPVYS